MLRFDLELCGCVISSSADGALERLGYGLGEITR